MASAAYRSGEKLEDKRAGETFDYTRKQAVEATRIMAPSPAPAWVMDRSQLWNTVEATEKRKDAQLAREVQVAIPDELPKEIREQLVWDFCQDNFVDMGMVADVAIHGPTKDNPRNWHFHAMLTMRTIGPDGFGLKERTWNENQHVERWKQKWEAACNAALEQIGSNTRVDMRAIVDRHQEQVAFAAKATNWIDRMRFEIEAARLDYTARPNLPQKVYRAAAKGDVYPGYEDETAEWKAAVESRGAARAKAMQLETELEYLLGLAHHDGGNEISAEDKIINRWLNDRFEHDPAIATMMATIADNRSDLVGSGCEAEAFKTFDQLGKNSDNPMHDQMAMLEGVGRYILDYGWKHLTKLEQVMRNHDVIWLFNERPQPIQTSSSAEKIETETGDIVDVQTEIVGTADIEVPSLDPNDESVDAPDLADAPIADTTTATEIELTSEQQASAELVGKPERTSTDSTPKDHSKFSDPEAADMEPLARGAAEGAKKEQEADEQLQEAVRTTRGATETPAPAQSAAEARRERQETKAEEKARRSAEKAAKRAKAKLERPINESRKRVLRGRKTINLVKGTYGNISTGREALEPYSQVQLRAATNSFLSAAKWLSEVWETYRAGEKREPKFEREEQDYITASEKLTEMHLVVPKPKAMTGEHLIDERARLQELDDFPDQGLIAPVMGTIKKRLKQVVAYLTNTDDGKAKAEEVAGKQRAEEAEQQRQYEQEQRLLEQRQKERAEERRRSTIKKVSAILERALEDTDIYDIVASYGFTDDQNIDEIAQDPSWDSLTLDTRRVAWHDLEERVKDLDANRQRQADEAKLQDLAETIMSILDRAANETDQELTKLLSHLDIYGFREQQDVLSDLRWMEPVNGDDKKRPLWEVAKERIEQLDAIAERVKKQRDELERQKAEQQKTSQLPSPSKRNDGFKP